MSIQIRVVGLAASAIIASAASAQTAVEWKVSEGGNGHWYALSSDGGSWEYAKASSEALGGHLATIGQIAESNFINSGVGRGWIGAFQAANACEPGCAWQWVTGETWAFTRWSAREPNDSGSVEDVVVTYGDGTWNDADASGGSRYLIEWELDCNADGIVDYGQIHRGELDDDNANGIPDVCETSVTGVTPPSVPSQGGATVTIKGANFPDNPTVLIGGVAATDVVRLSATRITATSPALLPGMASISVNGFTLPEALYIRPECGSDLDQNGTVDTGDISIILLDFGPCYQAPLAAPATEVPPLLDAQALPDAPRQR